MIFLNHGSYGACPREVLAAQADWQRQLEAQPCQFINAVAPKAIRAAAAELGAYVGANPDNLGFVENTTAGINAVLRSFSFQAGDEVVVTDHIYNAVRQTLNFVLAPKGARMVVAPIGLPVTGPAQIIEAVLNSITPATKLIVIDHVASITAVRFPVAEIAAEARTRGIPVLVDGAHAPGMIELDVEALGGDWYVGNCHKWLCAPKGAAFLWAAPARHEGLHPTVISHDLGKGFTFEFDKVGTRDASAWLSVPAAIAFQEKLGGAALRQRNHEVAVTAAQTLAERWGTETGAPPEMCGTMAVVRLPEGPPMERAISEAIKAEIWAEHRAEVHIMPLGNAFWLRLSVQAYNSLDDCLAIAPMVEAALARHTQTG